MNIEKEKELYRQMDLLQMKEVSTYRQQKNGTRIFELPIIKYGSKIQVGSFKSGYVRRMNGGYTPYQLNKTEKFDHYYKLYDYSSDKSPKFNGNYRKHECVKRILIDNEYDRIEYLITYCLKNYYINQANMIEDGKFIPKWKYENMMNRFESAAMELDRNHFEKSDEVNVLKEEINKLNNEIVDSRDRGALDNLTVFVNNEKYKII